MHFSVRRQLLEGHFKILPIWTGTHIVFNRHNRKKTAEGFYLRCCFSRNDSLVSRQRFVAKPTSTKCRRCMTTDESIRHIILDCPTLQPFRLKLRSTLQKLFPNIPINLTTLLTNTKFQPYVIKYIHSILTPEPSSRFC